jgi:hypothetical protein
MKRVSMILPAVLMIFSVSVAASTRVIVAADGSKAAVIVQGEDGAALYNALNVSPVGLENQTSLKEFSTWDKSFSISCKNAAQIQLTSCTIALNAGETATLSASQHKVDYEAYGRSAPSIWFAFNHDEYQGVSFTTSDGKLNFSGFESRFSVKFSDTDSN